MKKFIALLLIIGLIIAAGILLKKRTQSARNAPTPIPPVYPVKVVSPKVMSLQQTRPFLAQLTSVHSANIASKLNGRIKAVRVTETQAVKKGDLLVQIDDLETLSAIKSLEETLKSQKADLKYTQTLHARDKAIFKVGGLAREKLEASEVAVAGKQAVLEATRQKIAAQQIQLSYLNILAPFDGTVAAIFLRKGNLATPGQPLLTLRSPEQKLTFNYVPKQPNITPGQAVFVRKKRIGKVLKRYSDANNGLSVAEIRLDHPLDQPDNSYLNIQVATFEGTGCTVPVNALLHQKEGTRVMVYENDRFNPFSVTILGQNRDHALIEPCPSSTVAVGSEAKLSLLSTYGPVRIIRGDARE